MSSVITVFIIDDNESTQRAMARLMKAARFQTYCVSSVEDLLSKELPTHDAVIIADVNTTRGFTEILPWQLHGEAWPLPVIYLTDYDTESTRNEARRIGAAGYFRTPIDEQALLDAITFAVRHAPTEQTTKRCN